MPEIIIQKIAYGGWNNCVRITNGSIDLIITVDVGPRIIRCGFVDQENEMCEIASTMGETGGDEWRLYGGHRLWHSPEDRRRTYVPDNSPVQWEAIPHGIRTVQEPEALTGIIKEMKITITPDTGIVRISHRLTNTGPNPI